MGPNFIPNGDADFGNWLDNYSGIITADPLILGLQTSDATALASLTATFDTALLAATGLLTRSPVTVAAKDTARANAEGRARQLAAIIQANPAVTVEQKTALGITVRKTNKTPIPTPVSEPIISWVGTTTLQHTLRYADQNTPSSRIKPFGASALLLSVWVSAIGAEPVGPPVQMPMITRNPFAVMFQSGDLGKLATYSGQWVTSTGLMGPMSGTLAKVIG